MPTDLSSETDVNQTFANARIVQRDGVRHGWLRVEEGIIAAMGDGADVRPGAIDLDGHYLTPGLIDIHTDSLEKHITPRIGVRWNPVTAAISHDVQVIGSGITTVFDALAFTGGRANTNRAKIIAPMVQGLRAAIEMNALKAEHFLHLRCEVADPDILGMVEPYAGDPLVRMLSIMDHTPGQGQFRDLGKWRAAHAVFAEEDLDTMIARKISAQDELAPAQSRAIALLAADMGAILASHDDDSAAQIDKAAALGVHISEFPVTVEAARAARAKGIAIAMGAPNLVCGGSHSGNVAASDLAAEGLLDILASDYMPISMMQGALMLTLPPHDRPIHEALATVTWRPAEALGMHDRGMLETGRKADLVHLMLAGDIPVIQGVWRSGKRVA